MKPTKIAFNLNQLIDRYIYAYSPSFEVRRKSPVDGSIIYVTIPIYEDFTKLMNLINRDTESMKKYRKDLLGTSMLFNHPPIHSEIAAANTRHVTWDIWKHINIRDRAKMVAFDAIDNMKQILQKHYQMSEERAAKFKSEINKKKK